MCVAVLLAVLPALPIPNNSSCPGAAICRRFDSQRFPSFLLPQGHGVPSPPAWLLQALAQRLRSKTGLSLFNFDVIVPMHLHRRRPHATSSAAEVATSPPAVHGSSIAAAAAAAVAEADASAPQHLNGGGTLVHVAAGGPAADEEPVALDLREAVAAEAAALSASASLDTELPQQAAAELASSAAQQAQQQQAAAASEPGEQQELLYHLIDINYFPGVCPCWLAECPQGVMWAVVLQKACSSGMMCSLPLPTDPSLPDHFVQATKKCPTTRTTSSSSCAQ